MNSLLLLLLLLVSLTRSSWYTVGSTVGLIILLFVYRGYHAESRRLSRPSSVCFECLRGTVFA